MNELFVPRHIIVRLKEELISLERVKISEIYVYVFQRMSQSTDDI